jgi:nitrogen fixation/metabolism regulation signal transduction histidine kinase
MKEEATGPVPGPGNGEPEAPDPSPKTAAQTRHPLSEFVQILIVYALSVAVISIYAGQALRAAPHFPGAADRLPLFILAILPLSLLGLFLYRMRVLVLDLRRRRYGSRLKLRLVGLFLIAVVAAALPQGLVLLRLARASQSSAASADIREGLGRGLDLALQYYADDARRLEYAALHDIPLLALGKEKLDPRLLLFSLKAREPRIDALEVFAGGSSLAYAGPPEARLGSPPGLAAAGPLPSSTVGRVVRLRYLLPWKGRGGAIVLSLRLPDNFEEAAAALSRAKSQAELMAPFSAKWLQLLSLMYLLLVLPLLLLASLLGLAAANFVIEPVISLEAATRRVASGDLGLRILVKPGDETGRLLASFNRMLAEIERYREGDLHRGKISAWKDIAQRLAHELKNPLTPIRLAAERLLRASRADPGRALGLIEPSMMAIVAEVEGMDALLGDFRAFAALPEPDRVWTDLRGIVADSVGLYAASYPEVVFSYEGVAEDIALRVDRNQLKRALANLFANAVEAMEGRGRIEIRADLVKTADSRYCRLQVRDDGPGMSSAVLDRIFAPYFTTKKTGTGLGLAIVERIILDNGGSIRCESEEGAGASFYIDLPLER